MDFVPPNKRTEEYFKSVFDEKGLQEIVKLHLAQVIFLKLNFITILSFAKLGKQFSLKYLEEAFREMF